jgi:hypothetical protein
MNREAARRADRVRRSVQEPGLLGEMTDAVDRAEYAG